MPVGIVEVHHVDRVDARLLQSHVVVDEGGFDAGQENPAVAQVRGGAPHAAHDLGGERLRVALVVELLVLVRPHVEQHGQDGLVAGRLVPGEVTRAGGYVVRVGGKIAVVLPVHEQQVHAE